MEFLSGEYSHQMDAKNRIRIPAKFRKLLGADCFFMLLKGCIGVYAKSEKDRVLEKLRTVTSGDEKRAQARLVVSMTVKDVEEDEQGRTVLSPLYRKHAGIVKDIVTIGAIDHLEIWAKERLDEVLSEMSIDDAVKLLDF